MQVLKCIIVEDEPLARELLASYIEKVPYLQLVKTFENALDAFQGMQIIDFDIIFLDIQMPGMTGLELLRSLIIKPYVILVTAYPEYAVDGFNLEVTDYLLKPVLFERFLKSISKVTSLNKKSVDPGYESKKSEADPYMYFRVNKETIKIYLKDILWIESLKDYVKIKTIENEWVTYQRISDLEEKLPASLFLRVHRSFIIAINKVDALTNTNVRIGNNLITIGSSYKQEVFKQLKN